MSRTRRLSLLLAPLLVRYFVSHLLASVLPYNGESPSLLLRPHIPLPSFFLCFLFFSFECLPSISRHVYFATPRLPCIAVIPLCPNHYPCFLPLTLLSLHCWKVHSRRSFLLRWYKANTLTMPAALTDYNTFGNQMCSHVCTESFH